MSLLSKVKVRVHKAYFAKDPTNEYYFINIQNKYKRQEIIIDLLFLWINLWVNDNAIENDMLRWAIGNSERPMPAHIAPNSEWETWIPIKALNDFLVTYNYSSTVIYNHIMAKTSRGRYITSKKRKNVRSSGAVPGAE